MPSEDLLPFAPAAERNKQPILEVLLAHLPSTGKVLEIGSGTGQHAVHFAQAMPGIQWQPSEREQNLSGLHARLMASALTNIKTAVALEVGESGWPAGKYDAIFAANVAHIMSFENVQLMLRGVSRHLLFGGQFLLYGPFHRNGQPTSQGNADFDTQMRSSDNPDGRHQGIRDDRDMQKAAQAVGLNISEDIDMPANNRILVFTHSH